MSVFSRRPPSPLRAGAISFLEYKNFRFIIMDCPCDDNLPMYIKELKAHNVTDVVRVCEETYSSAPLNVVNIEVHDWFFEDGGLPPTHIVSKWLELLARRNKTTKDIENPPAIAIHCVAGLGRAPVMVAIALIENGMAPLDAIEFIRRQRRGAFNSRQIGYIDSYKKQRGKSASSFFNKMFRSRKVEVN